MKSLFAISLICLGLFASQNSHAFSICVGSNYNCDHYTPFGAHVAGDTTMMWATSTTTFGPIAIVDSGEMDLNSVEARETLASQSDLVLSGSEDSINPSENLIFAFAQSLKATDEEVAKAVQSLLRTDAAVSLESIKTALQK